MISEGADKISPQVNNTDKHLQTDAINSLCFCFGLQSIKLKYAKSTKDTKNEIKKKHVNTYDDPASSN